jgi:hypothetical protein
VVKLGRIHSLKLGSLILFAIIWDILNENFPQSTPNIALPLILLRSRISSSFCPSWSTNKCRRIRSWG